jgi:hypothetical protein
MLWNVFNTGSEHEKLRDLETVNRLAGGFLELESIIMEAKKKLTGSREHYSICQVNSGTKKCWLDFLGRMGRKPIGVTRSNVSSFEANFRELLRNLHFDAQGKIKYDVICVYRNGGR